VAEHDEAVRRATSDLPNGTKADVRVGGLVNLRGRRRIMVSIGALVVLGALIARTKAAERPPSPVPASAPKIEFSAQRAWGHLERIASEEPTPIGSAASDEVRDYLVDELSALGLDVEVQEGVGARAFGADTVAGRVENVVATIPGDDPTGRVLLAAHYDTTFGTPGASDDKAAVAAILETARALRSGEQPRNDVVLLLTDGEEPGLLGAASFVEQHPYGDDGGVVLNWEATGNAGPSVLFETSAGNAALIEEFAASAPYPVGEAAMAELYELSSQNTDFTVLKEEGFAGLNFAFIDGRAYYHNPRDTIDNFDPASMQHHGANMLALARAFGERDLATLDSDTNVTFFTLFGVAIRYPAFLVWPLAGFSVLAIIALSLVARRRTLVAMPRLVGGVAAALIPLTATPVAAIGLWELLVLIRPAYAGMGDPYRPELYRGALAALTATIVVCWYALLWWRIGAAAMSIGALAWPAVLGVATAWLAPGLSYYGSLPAAAAACGCLVALMIDEKRAAWRVVALTAGMVPGVLILIVGATGFLAVMGIPLGACAAFFFVLAGLLMLPLVELAMQQDLAEAPDPARGRPILRRWVVLLPLTTTLVGGLTGAGLAVDRFDENHPEPAHLMYVLDADTGTALWASEDDAPQEWTARYVTDRGAKTKIPLPYRTDPKWSGPAEAVPLEAPEVTVLGSRNDGKVTVLELRLSSQRGADVLTLHADRPVQNATIAADDHPPVTSTPSYPGDAGTEEWPYELRFYDPPAEGIRVTLRLPTGQPLRVGLSDYTVGLEEIPGFTEPPPDVDRSTFHSSDLLIVGRTHELASPTTR
jgi:hypothetical protein